MSVRTLEVIFLPNAIKSFKVSFFKTDVSKLKTLSLATSTKSRICSPIAIPALGLLFAVEKIPKGIL